LFIEKLEVGKKLMTHEPHDSEQQPALSARYWFHHISRDMIESGKVQALIDQGVIGFMVDGGLMEKAIGEGVAYDDQLYTLDTTDGNTILEQLLIHDAQAAADLLLPIYAQSLHDDGFMCVGVSPLRVEDPNALLEEARRLAQAIDRPNILLNIPGAPDHLPVIEQLLSEGINVNITHVHSQEAYAAAAECYLRALRQRLAQGLPIQGVTSVVSFGVGVIDAVVDKQLANNIRSAQTRGDFTRVGANNNLIGRVGVANAAHAYRRYHDIFEGDSFNQFREQGAHPQRLLWMRLDTPNATYDKLLYFAALGSKDTRCLVTEDLLATLEAQGEPDDSLIRTVRLSTDILHEAAQMGFDLSQIGRTLQTDALESRIENYSKVIARIVGKRNALLSGFMGRQSLLLGMYQGAVEAQLKLMRSQKRISRLWATDPALWKFVSSSPSSERQEVEARLAWLGLPTSLDRARLGALRAEAQQWARILVYDPEDLCLAGSAWATPLPPKWEAITQLDALTDANSPATVILIAARQQLPNLANIPSRARLIILAEEGTNGLGDLPARDVFLTPAGLSAPFAALGYYGLVPAALLDLDTDKLLDCAAEMQAACGASVMGNNHPGLWLGAALGTLANNGRNKLTLLAHPALRRFGLWLELLLASTLGKAGKGVIPVIGATVGMPHDYDDDRVFIYLRIEGDADNPDESARALQQAGNPMLVLTLRHPEDLAAEYFRWQFGAMAAAMVLEVDPFDFVAEAPTASVLPALVPVAFAEDFALYADAELAGLLQVLVAQQAYEKSPLVDALAAYLTLARSGEYIAVSAATTAGQAVVEALELHKRRARHVLKRAITLHNGQRALRRVARLHADGPSNGLFLQIVPLRGPISEPEADFAEAYLATLQKRGRRALRLMGEVGACAELLLAAVEAVAEKRI
jgi:transaldolase / glucose-6-phosphate isomerase